MEVLVGLAEAVALVRGESEEVLDAADDDDVPVGRLPVLAGAVGPAEALEFVHEYGADVDSGDADRSVAGNAAVVLVEADGEVVAAGAAPDTVVPQSGIPVPGPVPLGNADVVELGSGKGVLDDKATVPAGAVRETPVPPVGPGTAVVVFVRAKGAAAVTALVPEMAISTPELVTVDVQVVLELEGGRDEVDSPADSGAVRLNPKPLVLAGAVLRLQVVVLDRE